MHHLEGADHTATKGIEEFALVIEQSYSISLAAAVLYVFLHISVHFLLEWSVPASLVCSLLVLSSHTYSPVQVPPNRDCD